MWLSPVEWRIADRFEKHIQMVLILFNLTNTDQYNASNLLKQFVESIERTRATFWGL